MQLCKLQLADGDIRIGSLADAYVRLLDLEDYVGMNALSDILHADDPATLAHDLLEDADNPLAVDEVKLLAPLDRQDVWAAGVTYKRSQEARERESPGAARFYDLVYEAPRPELFFKATADRVSGPGERLHIRRDSRWSVPEPELALVLSPHLEIVGYTIGNDMSARDIEGENPLYLPQAKVYDRSCALGPAITLAGDLPPLGEVTIRLQIERSGRKVFEGTTSPSAMHRSFSDLISWLGRENSFPHGAVLLTGTGIVPPDDFALQHGDLVTIDVTGIGRLVNIVEQRGEGIE
jgi:2-dehydro-3-deoxy-D-arabinonate dehydratase